MASSIFHFATIEVALNTGPDIRDITDDLNRIIGRSGIENGQATACIVGSTGSLTTIEYEPGVVQDLKDAINRLAPKDLAYAHELAWHDGNGHSHVQAALLGPSIALPIRQASCGWAPGSRWWRLITTTGPGIEPSKSPCPGYNQPVSPIKNSPEAVYYRPAIPITLSLMAGIILGQGLPGFVFPACSSCLRLPFGWPFV